MEKNRPFLRIAAGEWVPYSKVNRLDDGNITISGPMNTLLHLFSSIIGFDYSLIPAPGNLWGGPLPNGTWTGMLGMLHRQEVELAIAPFFVNPLRAEVSDFSVPVYSDYQAILMQRPSLQNDLMGFLKPFAPLVWVLVVVSVVVLSGAMYWIVKGETFVYKYSQQTSWTRIVLWAIQAFSQENSEWLPEHDGGRVLVATWLMASLVFMSSYSGILTAMLTVPRVTIPIDSLQDLVSQSHMPWRLEAGSMMYSFFEESTDELGRQVFSEKAGTFQDCWAARRSIVRGEFAAICDKTTMMKSMSWDFTMSGQCHLYKSQKKVYSDGILSIAFKINSTYTQPANRIIESLKGGGLLNKWLGEQLSNSTQCTKPPSADDDGKGIKPLNIQVFSGPLLVLATGYVIGLVALAGEHVISVYYKNKAT